MWTAYANQQPCTIYFKCVRDEGNWEKRRNDGRWLSDAFCIDLEKNGCQIVESLFKIGSFVCTRIKWPDTQRISFPFYETFRWYVIFRYGKSSYRMCYGMEWIYFLKLYNNTKAKTIQQFYISIFWFKIILISKISLLRCVWKTSSTSWVMEIGNDKSNFINCALFKKKKRTYVLI